jgi:hypothetical protein
MQLNCLDLRKHHMLAEPHQQREGPIIFSCVFTRPVSVESTGYFVFTDDDYATFFLPS